ncbi:MAG TPA: nucleoside triphosphate pyrophosphohydrolase [Acidobacteriaceae bacterium]|jgi:ATP diphosphatase|nr:nucleoside triphosphate pyrophosphohydrolase [Acidobacteriaceae bacterium]
MDSKERSAAEQFAEAVRIMARLRAPGGCPWDREQSFDSIKKYTLEETYEVFDAIERRNWPDLKDELGDLLLQVLFYSQMAMEAGDFTIADVVESLNAKLVRRHPHVFGEIEAATSGEVLKNWEQIKESEKRAARQKEKQQRGTEEKASLLQDVSRTMPAMMEAEKLGSRAAKVGFDWPEDGRATGLFQKLDEEIAELREAIACAMLASKKRPPHTDEISAEFGDLLFTVANIARHLKIDSESALRGANAKFRRRFAAMEREINAKGGPSVSLNTLSAEELEALWQQAKQRERAE